MEYEVFSDDITYNVLEQLALSGDYAGFTKFLRTVKKPSNDLLSRIRKLEHPLTFVVRIGTHPVTKTRFDSFTIPFEEATKANIRVDWGDSYMSYYELTNNGERDKYLTHTYDDVPKDKFITYKVRVFGILNHLGVDKDSKLKHWADNIIEFVSLGKIGIISLEYLFYGSNFNRPINHLDVSDIISTRSMLEDNTQFNQRISDMNFDNLINCAYMLTNARRMKGSYETIPRMYINSPLLRDPKDSTQFIKNKQRINELNKIWRQQFGSVAAT